MLAAGGKAIGVIPEPLAVKEIAHQALTELHVVRDMHERKAMMASRSAAFLTLPGGIGTFEEFFETLSWATLGLHHKPIGVLNTAGYFDPMIALLDHAVAQKFIKPEHRRYLLISADAEGLVAEVMRHAGSESPKQRIDLDLD